MMNTGRRDALPVLQFLMKFPKQIPFPAKLPSGESTPASKPQHPVAGTSPLPGPTSWEEWLFGGEGFPFLSRVGKQPPGLLNDLWVFDGAWLPANIHTWNWWPRRSHSQRSLGVYGRPVGLGIGGLSLPHHGFVGRSPLLVAAMASAGALSHPL